MAEFYLGLQFEHASHRQAEGDGRTQRNMMMSRIQFCNTSCNFKQDSNAVFVKEEREEREERVKLIGELINMQGVTACWLYSIDLLK